MDYTKNFMNLSVDVAFNEFYDRCRDQQVMESMLNDLLSNEGDQRFVTIEEIPYYAIGESVMERMSRLYFHATRSSGEEIEIQLRFINTIDDASRENLILRELTLEKADKRRQEIPYMLINFIHLSDFDLMEQNQFIMRTYFDQHDPARPLFRDFELVTISLPQFQQKYRKKEIDSQSEKYVKWLLLLSVVNAKTQKVNRHQFLLLEKMAQTDPIFQAAISSWNSLMDNDHFVSLYKDRSQRVELLHRIETNKRNLLKTRNVKKGIVHEMILS